MNPVDLLTTAEAASAYRVSISTIKRWVRSGKLPSVRIGRRHLIPTDNPLSEKIAAVVSGRGQA
jgi:excisionase family DNA binding protein